MFCKNCGKEVGDNAYVCPHCGVKVENEVQPIGNQKNTLAIIGFIFAFLIPIVGLICSIIGLKKANELGSGRGLAIAGIVISILNWIAGFIIISALM